MSARLRLTLSYAIFLVAAGAAVLIGVYLVFRYVPNYPLTAANSHDLGNAVASRGDILAAVVGVSGAILAALASVGLIGGWILAGWILRPLERIADAAQRAAEGQLDHRIHLAGRNDEFRALADTFDVMLDRLHDAFIAQERFASNASHELRTPLAITATLLDVAQRNPAGQDYPELIDRLEITNNRAIGLTEALLRMADANSISAVAEAVNLAEIARRCITECEAEASDRKVVIDAQLSAATTSADGTLLGQLVENLVQNAVRHSSSPGRAEISTRIDSAQRVVVIETSNTGLTYTAEQANELREPFLRGEGRVRKAGQPGGFGLGLALVARIVELHHGALTIAPRSGGGLVVSATIPCRTTF